MSIAITPSGADDDGVAVELADLGQLVGEHADAQQQVLERGDVSRRRAAVAEQQGRRTQRPDELRGVDVGQRYEPQRGVADELGADPAHPEQHERTEARVLGDADDRLDARSRPSAARRRHRARRRAQSPSRRRRGGPRPRRCSPSTTPPTSVLCTIAPAPALSATGKPERLGRGSPRRRPSRRGAAGATGMPNDRQRSVATSGSSQTSSAAVERGVDQPVRDARGRCREDRGRRLPVGGAIRRGWRRG